MRRLNLGVLDHLEKHHGVIIVDTTRRGKRMPDSFSKTIPIWCAVLNFLLFGDLRLFTPTQCVSASEASQIQAQVPRWAREIAANGLDVQAIKSKVNKPLRPIWLTPDAKHGLPLEPPVFTEVCALVLCTASEMAQDGALTLANGISYVQGAADDHELWAANLTPRILWSHRHTLLSARISCQEILDHIDEYSRTSTNVQLAPVYVEVNSWLSFGTHPASKIVHVDLCNHHNVPDCPDRTHTLKYPLDPGKRGAKRLRLVLPEILHRLAGPCVNVHVTCDTGSDFSVGVALAVLCCYEDRQGMPYPRVLSSKQQIREQLVRLMQVATNVQPSRATLTAVNACLLDGYSVPATLRFGR